MSEMISKSGGKQMDLKSVEPTDTDARGLNFLRRLTDDFQFGAIVSSGSCTEAEITNARTKGHFFVDDDGFGYVLKPAEWLADREEAYKEATRRVSASVPSQVLPVVPEALTDDA